jgi:hypothetical protein
MNNPVQYSTPVNIEQQLLHSRQHNAINTVGVSTHHHTKSILSTDHTPARNTITSAHNASAHRTGRKFASDSIPLRDLKG